MRDAIYIIGIVLGVGLAFTVGRVEGRVEGAKSVLTATPLEADVEKQCVTWFFNEDLKAAKKHMCGSRK